jgi:hypothetical protein
MNKEPLDYIDCLLAIPFFYMDYTFIPKPVRALMLVVIGIPLNFLIMPVFLLGMIVLGSWQVYHDML